jgi:nucleotide-binding universal stress UspA family protein
MKILVPVDGSGSSHRALEHALELYRLQPRSSIVLVNAQHFPGLGVSEMTAVLPPDWEQRAADAQSKKALRTAAETCRKRRVRFEKLTVIGPIAETIIATAKKIGADQIVMGTRGIGAVRQMLLGSVASKVVHLAEIPVTLVR